MDLFGRQGYHATTIAQIEAAAGLSAGAGGLYRHFSTKRALLEEGLRRQFEAGRPLVAHLEQTGAGLPRRERFLAVARAGLHRLEQERDVNRLLLRDLASFPDLLEQVRSQELARVHEALTGWVARESPKHPDPGALAAVLMAAISHYWVFSDIFAGRHPHGVDSERFLRTLADLAAGPAGPEAHQP
jgi:AcrR family transcriptional regulator